MRVLDHSPNRRATRYPIAVPQDNGRREHDLDLLILDQVQSWGWDDILFVECGDGWAPEEAWRRRRTRGHVVALDRSAGATERGRTLRGVVGRVEFATWDGQHFCQPSGMFDQLISKFAFQNSSDSRAVAQEMLRVLRPGGEIYALEPASSAGEVQKVLASAGFSRIEELGGGTGKASAVVLHARARTFE